ncbi:MAG: GNAT family N-acetyltransferase [Streptosporangiaceae bacterium]
MSIELFDPRLDPEPPGWQEFRTGEGLTAIWSYEAIRKASEGTPSPLLLALFRHGPTIVGALTGVYLGLRRPGSVTAPRRRREPIVLDVRLPGEGNEVSWHFRADVSAEQRRELMREFERAVRHWLGRGLAGIVYRHVTPGEVATVARAGAVARASVGTARMPITWKNVDGWLATLGGSRRRNLRRRARLIDADPDLTVESGTRRTDLDPALLARMVADQQRRLQNRIDPRVPLSAGYFAEMVRRDDVSFLTYTEGSGRLLAFSTLLHHPSWPQLGWWSGLPIEEGGRGHLYFDHYLRTVEQVIGQGSEGLIAGRGRLEVKRELGFREVPMKLVAVPRWSLG